MVTFPLQDVVWDNMVRMQHLFAAVAEQDPRIPAALPKAPTLIEPTVTSVSTLDTPTERRTARWTSAARIV